MGIKKVARAMNTKNAKCWHYEPKNKMDKVNCPNCKHWAGTRCRDEQLLIDRYTESNTYKSYDHMMRQNKGVRIE